MGRQARKISRSGLYHIIFRGISRQNIFEETADYEKIKQIIQRVKEETKMQVYAYCLMSNHVHMFIKENEAGQISSIMTKILSHYATWFNIKYLRTGTLFGSRYKSEPVEDECYFLSLARYIHQNPVKAGMTLSAKDYEYSSYNDYANNLMGLTDVDFLLDVLSTNRSKAIEAFVDFHKNEETEDFEIVNAQGKNSAQVRRLIMREIDGKTPETIKEMPKQERNELIKKLVDEVGISKSALERATGISRGVIIRIMKEV